MILPIRPSLVSALGIFAVLSPVIAERPSGQNRTLNLRGAMIKPADASRSRLQELQASGVNTVVFPLRSSGAQAKESVRVAVTSAKRVGLAFAYWIEVARSPELADEHPEWMASLQTHDQWRRFFPDTPRPNADQVTKTYPWVPILSRAPFDAQLKRTLALIAELPTADLIFLNDLQGAPSACGCGNALCRWTSDYGNRRTTVPLGDDAAARFISQIQKSAPGAEVVPVWTTECEEHDGSPDGLCAGVGCFKGICWKAYHRQLMPVADACKRVAVLALYKEFQRDIPLYGPAEASWVEFAIETFETMPPRHNGEAIKASRMIAVLQGWDVTTEQIEAQRKAVTKAGAKGYVIAYDKIDQSWSPRIVAWK